MKIKIKSYYGYLPEYLTVGKVYEVVTQMNYLGLAQIYSDDGFLCDVQLLDKSLRLNGGLWEVVDNECY